MSATFAPASASNVSSGDSVWAHLARATPIHCLAALVLWNAAAWVLDMVGPTAPSDSFGLLFAAVVWSGIAGLPLMAVTTACALVAHVRPLWARGAAVMGAGVAGCAALLLLVLLVLSGVTEYVPGSLAWTLSFAAASVPVMVLLARPAWLVLRASRSAVR